MDYLATLVFICMDEWIWMNIYHHSLYGWIFICYDLRTCVHDWEEFVSC